MFCSTRLQDELGSRVLYLLEWSDDCLWIACQQGIAVVDREHELTSAMVASSVRYWRMGLMRLISMYAALHGLIICCFIERLLSKKKPRSRTIPENSISVSLRVVVCGSCKVRLTEEEAEKRMASVLSLFSLSLFSSIHGPISLTQF